MDRAEFLRNQFERLVNRWKPLVDGDPDRVAREAKIFMRWIERFDPISADERLIRSVIVEICFEIIAAAELRRR